MGSLPATRSWTRPEDYVSGVARANPLHASRDRDNPISRQQEVTSCRNPNTLYAEDVEFKLRPVTYCVTRTMFKFLGLYRSY